MSVIDAAKAELAAIRAEVVAQAKSALTPVLTARDGARVVEPAQIVLQWGDMSSGTAVFRIEDGSNLLIGARLTGDDWEVALVTGTPGNYTVTSKPLRSLADLGRALNA